MKSFDDLPQDQFIYGLDEETYFAVDAVHSSLLREYVKSPAHAEWSLNNPVEVTDSMRLGSAVHCAVLEPDTFADRWAALPEDLNLRTRAGREERNALLERYEGRVLKAEDMEKAQRVRDKILSDPACATLLDRVPAESREVSIAWRDVRNDQNCIVRLDGYAPPDGGNSFILDIKTTRDASPSAFSKVIADRKYHVQAGYYAIGTMKAEGSVQGADFYFIAAETAPPFNVQAYKLRRAEIGEGLRLAKKALEGVAQCRASGQWPGYARQCLLIERPAWAKRHPALP